MNPVVPGASTAQESIRKSRRARARRLTVRLGAFVGVPTLTSIGYFGFVATDAYESVALFSIQAADARPSVSLESLVSFTGASPASRDTLAARDFVLSREMFDFLNREVGLIEHYRSPQVDFFSRLDADDSLEDAYEYYRDQVRVVFDSNSGVLTLRVRAFSSEQAHRTAEAILRASETKVNRLSEQARRDQIIFAQTEVEKAEKRLSAGRQALVQMQQKHGELNPEQTAAAAMTIRTQLEAELAKARAEYAALRSYMAEDSPQVIAAREKARSLAGQAASEGQRLVNARDAQGLNASVVEFEEVIVEKEFATHAYQSALASLELARSDAARQHRYLATIAAPSVPDEAQYPRRFVGVLTVFLSSLLFFGIGSLSLAAVREHARL